MAKAKVLSIDAAGELVANIRQLRDQNRDLVDALNECVLVIEDQLVIIIDSYTIRGPSGAADLGTLAEDAKPEFERLTKALLAARTAIKKAGAM